MAIFSVALLVFLLGLVLLIYGYRIFLVMLPVWGFFAGFWLGAQATSLLLGSGFLATLSEWLIGLGCGLLFAVLSYSFYGAFIGIITAVLGYGLGYGLIAALLGPGLFAVVGGIMSALAVAVLVFPLELQRYIAMALMSISGANAILLAVLLLLGRVPIESLQAAGNAIAPVVRDSWFWLLVWFGLAVAGVWLQLRTSRAFEFRLQDYAEGWG